MNTKPLPAQTVAQRIASGETDFRGTYILGDLHIKPDDDRCSLYFAPLQFEGVTIQGDLIIERTGFLDESGIRLNGAQIKGYCHLYRVQVQVILALHAKFLQGLLVSHSNVASRIDLTSSWFGAMTLRRPAGLRLVKVTAPSVVLDGAQTPCAVTGACDVSYYSLACATLGCHKPSEFRGPENLCMTI